MESYWKTQKSSFALFTAISQVSISHCAWGLCVGVHRAMALMSDAKQATGEGKSGLVETGLAGLVATALVGMSFLGQTIKEWLLVCR